MIDSGDAKNLSVLLFHKPSPAIKELLQKQVMDKCGFGVKQDTEFVENDETVARFLDM